jgi:hypothetical protein
MGSHRHACGYRAGPFSPTRIYSTIQLGEVGSVQPPPLQFPSFSWHTYKGRNRNLSTPFPLNPIPAGLDAYIGLLQRCWAQAPADRPTFRQVVHELEVMESAL